MHTGTQPLPAATVTLCVFRGFTFDTYDILNVKCCSAEIIPYLIIHLNLYVTSQRQKSRFSLTFVIKTFLKNILPEPEHMLTPLSKM